MKPGSFNPFGEGSKQVETEVPSRPPKTSRQRELLHVHTTSKSAAGRVKELRTSGVSEGDPVSHEHDLLKRELYAISTLVTEGIYGQAAKLALAHPGAHASFIPPSGVEVGFVPADEIATRMEKDPLLTFLQIRDSFSALFEKTTEDFFADIPPAFSAACRRLEAILTAGKHPFDSKKFLRAGGYTAGVACGDMMAAIPLVFHRHLGRVPTPEEYLELAESGRRLIFDIASMHMYNLARLVDSNQTPSRLRLWDPQASLALFPVEFFGIERHKETGGKETWKLSFAPGFLEPWSSQMPPTRDADPLFNPAFTAESDAARYGCPALAAKVTGVDGRQTNVVDAAFDYTRDIAKKYLVPHLREFVEASLLRQFLEESHRKLQGT